MAVDTILYGVGDMMPSDPHPDIHFENIKRLLSDENALSFGQLEGVISSELVPSNASPSHCACDVTLATAMKRAGFDIVSFAGNHSLDFGPKSFLEAIDRIREAGLVPVGVGKDEDEARAIRYMEKNGVRFAFLAYSSILPYGSWATKKRPGCNPARGLNAYEPDEPDQPGTHINVYTFPHPHDLKNMLEDIKTARANADIVVMSIHWGIHVTRAVLADYQRYYAHFAIDAGVDIILGHHAHTLKPVEVYKGKAIIYSLGNAALGNAEKTDDLELPPDAHLRKRGIFRCMTDPVVPGRDWHMGWYQSTIAKCVIRGKKIQSVSLIPTFMPEKPPTIFPKPGSEEFESVLTTLREITAEERLDTIYELSGNEILLPQTIADL